VLVGGHSAPCWARLFNSLRRYCTSTHVFALCLSKHSILLLSAQLSKLSSLLSSSRFSLSSSILTDSSSFLSTSSSKYVESSSISSTLSYPLPFTTAFLAQIVSCSYQEEEQCVVFVFFQGPPEGWALWHFRLGSPARRSILLA
jgi:hypothetical protein